MQTYFYLEEVSRHCQSYHLMPSNTLVLELYERGILKCTFRHTTGFCRFREEKRRQSRGDNFLQQLKRSEVSRICIAAARTEKLGTHTLTHRTTAIPLPLAYGGEGNKYKLLTEVEASMEFKY